MNAALIERWNSVVGKDDTVYHLGDFGMGNPNKLGSIRAQLNGKMVLIRGNHDHNLRKWLQPGDKWYRELIIGNQVYLTHVPPIDFDGRFPLPVPPKDTNVVLCGHVHNKWNKAATAEGRMIINVGCDIWKWTPVTPEQLGVEAYMP